VTTAKISKQDLTIHPTRHKTRRAMIVDDEPEVREALAAALKDQGLKIIEADCIATAERQLKCHKIDLMLVDVALPDGDGLTFVDSVAQHKAAPACIVITGNPSMQRAVTAMRSGVCDFLAKPLNLDELDQSVARALQQRDAAGKNVRRVRRLRQLCRKLNDARHQVTQQVDILCNDLVSAYQDLAGQMKHVQAVTQFKTQIEHELDLENLLRVTLEFLLQHIGPTNAVIFLPSTGGGFTTGGYYTFDKDTAEVLLGHLADIAAPHIVEADGLIHLTDEMDINLWLSNDSAWLADSHVAAFPCRHDGDNLAAVMFFRDMDEPFDGETLETVSAIGPVLAQHLTKVIGIHHRLSDIMDEMDDDDGEETFM